MTNKIAKFNKHNYYLDSFGIFKFLGKLDEREFWDQGNTRSREEMEQILQHVLITECKMSLEQATNFKFDYVSYSAYWNSFSAYFINEETNQLIRVSDHWSDVNIVNKIAGLTTCEFIRSCYWVLNADVQNWSALNGDENSLWIGLIDFNNLNDRQGYLFAVDDERWIARQLNEYALRNGIGVGIDLEKPSPVVELWNTWRQIFKGFDLDSVDFKIVWWPILKQAYYAFENGLLEDRKKLLFSLMLQNYNVLVRIKNYNPNWKDLFKKFNVEDLTAEGDNDEN